MYTVDWKLYFPLSPKWIQWYTSVYRLSPGCDDFTLIIAISVDRKLYFPLSADCLQNMYISGTWIENYIPRYPWIENYIFHCLPLSPEMWWFHFGHRDIRGSKLYSIVYRLFPEIWWIITFLEKVWQLHAMMYTVDWKLYSIVCRLSPEMWWFHFDHRDIRG